jgi:hypothetical protein
VAVGRGHCIERLAVGLYILFFRPTECH